MSLDFRKRVRNYKFKQCRSEDCNVFFYDANEILFLFFARLKYIIFQSLYWTIIFNSIFIVFCPFRLYIILSMNSAPKWDYWRKYCSPSFLYNFNKSSLRQFWETFCIPLNPLYYQQHKLFSTASNQSNT